MSRRSDLGGGVSLDASRVIERPLLRFGTSFARRRVSGVERAVAASRKSSHVVRVRIFDLRGARAFGCCQSASLVSSVRGAASLRRAAAEGCGEH